MGSRVFTVPLERIPPGSLLQSLSQTSMKVEKKKSAIVLSDNEDEIPIYEAIFDFLLTGKVPSWAHFDVLDYLGIDPRKNYEMGLMFEDEIRAKMYDPEYQNHPMNTDPYYGLIEITQELWEELELHHSGHLFTAFRTEKQSWEQVQESLKELEPLFEIPDVFVAGGRVFSALFGTRTSDVDIFLYGSQDPSLGTQRLQQIFQKLYTPDLPQKCNEMISEIERLQRKVAATDKDYQKIDEMHRRLCNSKDLIEIISEYDNFIDIKEFLFQANKYQPQYLYRFLRRNTEDIKRLNLLRKQYRKLERGKIIRSPNAVSFKIGIEYQVILRLYKSPSEIIHGFDVDCCCMGYDGKRLWITQRGLYSLANGFNTVNFDRLSPSYERRLAKYGTRGIAVKIPNFNPVNIDHEAMEKRFQETIVEKKDFIYDYAARRPLYKKINRSTDYKQLVTLKGLDTLLYLDFQAQKGQYKPRTIRTIEKTTEEFNDYYQKIPNAGNPIEWVLRYLIESRSSYPEEAKKYLPFLEGAWTEEYGEIEFEDPQDSHMLQFQINTIPYAKEINFIRTTFNIRYALDQQENLHSLLNITDRIYNCLGSVRPWKIPQRIQWKTIRPGEQMTGSFHKTVLDDRSVWYKGEFYH